MRINYKRKKKFLGILIIFLFVLVGGATFGAIVSNGVKADGEPVELVWDNESSIFVNGMIQVDGGYIAAGTYYDSNDYEFAGISKISDDGTEEWSVLTSHWGQYRSVVEIGDGEYIAVGYVHKVYGSAKALVSKFEVDSNNNVSEIYSWTYDESSWAEFSKILLDSDGDLILSGTINGGTNYSQYIHPFVKKISKDHECTVGANNNSICNDDLIWELPLTEISTYSYYAHSVDVGIEQGEENGDFYISYAEYGRAHYIKIKESTTLDSANIEFDTTYSNYNSNLYINDFVTVDGKIFLVRRGGTVEKIYRIGSDYLYNTSPSFSWNDTDNFDGGKIIAQDGNVSDLAKTVDGEYLLVRNNGSVSKYTDRGEEIWAINKDGSGSYETKTFSFDNGEYIICGRNNVVGSTEPTYVRKYRDNKRSYHVNYWLIDNNGSSLSLLQRETALSGEVFNYSNYDTLDNFKLDGWYIDPELTTRFESYDVPAREDINLYGKYTPIHTVMLETSQASCGVEGWSHHSHYYDDERAVLTIKVPDGQSIVEALGSPFDKTVSDNGKCMLWWSEYNRYYSSRQDYDPNTPITENKYLSAQWETFNLVVHQDGTITTDDGLNYDQNTNDGISWEANTDTLILDNYGFVAIEIDNGEEPVNLVLRGENIMDAETSIYLNREEPRPVLYSPESPLIITGNGSLTSEGHQSNYDVLILANDLTVGTEDEEGPELRGQIDVAYETWYETHDGYHGTLGNGTFTMNSGKIIGAVLAFNNAVINGGEIVGVMSGETNKEGISWVVNGGELNMLFFGLSGEGSSIVMNSGDINAFVVGLGEEGTQSITINDGVSVNAGSMMAQDVIVDGGEVNLTVLSEDSELFDYLANNLVPQFVESREELKENLRDEYFDTSILYTKIMKIEKGVVNAKAIFSEATILNSGELNINGGPIVAVMVFNQNGGVLNIDATQVNPTSAGPNYLTVDMGLGLMSSMFVNFNGGEAHINAALAGMYVEGEEYIDLSGASEEELAGFSEMFGGAKLPEGGLIGFKDCDVEINVSDKGMTPILVGAMADDEYGDDNSLIQNFDELPEDWAIKIDKALIVDPEGTVIVTKKDKTTSEEERCDGEGYDENDNWTCIDNPHTIDVTYYSAVAVFGDGINEPSIDLDEMFVEGAQKNVHIHPVSYTIEFIDENGVIISTETYDYGTEVQPPEEIPTKETTPKYRYNFVGWNDGSGSTIEPDNIPDATTNATYTAVFDKREYTPASEWLKNQEYTIDEVDQAVFRVDIANKFFNHKVTVDGTVITEGVDYDITEGSTIVTLKQAYLDGLTEGEHTMDVYFNEPTEDEDVVIATTFTAKKNNTPDTPDIPDTGEDGEEQENTNKKSGDHGFNTVDHSAVTVTIMLAATISSAFFVSRRVMRRK